MLDFGYFNMDCMDGMKQFPDKYFDIAIVDPPYGIKVKNNMGRRHGTKKSDYPKAYWDKVAPPPEYFTELFRVAKHSIIWGGNYFDLPPAKCFVIWDKPDKSENVTFAMCEYAWTDFDMTAKIFRKYAKDDCRIHATQKPVELYMWLLRIFAKEGDKILDTHVGSASSLIACHKMGFQYVGFELDKYYYDLSNKRLEQEKAQMSLFDFMGGGAVQKRRQDRVKLIYICSPYRADDDAILQRNIEYARELTRGVLLQGGVPVATHLYMTQCLEESVEEERNTGLAAGREILRRCDAVFVGAKYGISSGMKAEIELAKKNNIPVVFNKVMREAT